MTGGGTITFGSIRISSTDPIRPLIAAALLFAVYVLASGRQRLRDDVRHAVVAATAPRLAALLAVAVALVAVWHTSWTASGADAYAYVTQADLWLRGRLTVPVPIANEVPWPRPL